MDESLVSSFFLYLNIYIYIYMCECVRVCVCMYVCMCILIIWSELNNGQGENCQMHLENNFFFVIDNLHKFCIYLQINLRSQLILTVSQ